MSDLSPALAGADDSAPALGGVHLAQKAGSLFDIEPYQLAVDPVPFEAQQDMSAGRKRTARNEKRIADGFHPFGWPLRQPMGETCRTCQHATRVEYHNAAYLKCDLTEWTHGSGTDLRLKWPACEKWEARRPAKPTPDSPYDRTET